MSWLNQWCRKWSRLLNEQQTIRQSFPCLQSKSESTNEVDLRTRLFRLWIQWNHGGHGLLTMADHSATCILRRNFPDLTVTLLALVVMLSDANLAKTSPPLCTGQCSVNIRPNFGQCLVNLWLNFGRKGGEEAGCLVDESCLEQSVSRPDGYFELSHVGLGSGDWYVRHSCSMVSPDALI